MKILTLSLVGILAFLQYELWFSSNGGVREYFTLRKAIIAQENQDTLLEQQNQAMSVEIQTLKQGHEAIEEHARNDLGMIKPGETFYEVVKK
jgi:cell division protein FtsB